MPHKKIITRENGMTERQNEQGYQTEKQKYSMSKAMKKNQKKQNSLQHIGKCIGSLKKH